MGIIIKQSVKSTFISYIGIVLGAFNILWLYPKFLKPEEYGLIRLLQDIPFLFALIAQIGASSIADRFFHHFKDDHKNKGFLSMLLLYPLIGYSIFLASYFVFHDYWKTLFEAKAALFVDYIIYLLPLTLFMMYTAIMEAYLRANFSVNWSNFVRDILIRIFYTCFIVVYALKLISFDALLLCMVASYLVSLLTLFGYAKKIGVLHLTGIQLPEKGLLKEIGVYILFLIPGTAGSLIAQKIDTLMLGTISGHKPNEGLTNIAIYSMAYFIGSVIEVPRKSITQISIPILSAAFKNNDLPKVDELYKKNSITQLISGVIIFLLIWINIDELFLFIPNGEIYKEGKYVILFVGISKLFDMATSINGEIIQFSKYFKFNIIALVLLALLTVGLNFIFIERYAITGASIALAITVFLFNTAKTYFIYHRMRLNPFTKGMIPLTIFTIVVLAISFYAPTVENNLLLSLGAMALRSVLCCAAFYFLLRKFPISEDVTSFINKMIVLASEKTGQAWIRKFL